MLTPSLYTNTLMKIDTDKLSLISCAVSATSVCMYVIFS
jgi:hypothetical protein